MTISNSPDRNPAEPLHDHIEPPASDRDNHVANDTSHGRDHDSSDDAPLARCDHAAARPGTGCACPSSSLPDFIHIPQNIGAPMNNSNDHTSQTADTQDADDQQWPWFDEDDTRSLADLTKDNILLKHLSIVYNPTPPAEPHALAA